MSCQNGQNRRIHVPKFGLQTNCIYTQSNRGSLYLMRLSHLPNILLMRFFGRMAKLFHYCNFFYMYQANYKSRINEIFWPIKYLESFEKQKSNGIRSNEICIRRGSPVINKNAYLEELMFLLRKSQFLRLVCPAIPFLVRQLYAKQF